MLTKNNRFWGIFWVDVGTPVTAERDFITIAKLIGRPVETVFEALQILANCPQSWLLVLDNADDPDYDYQTYLPSGNHGAVLITSRVAECKQYSPDAYDALQGLESQESEELLRKAAGISLDLLSTSGNQAAAEKVIQLLASHTLALIQAGAYIAQGHCKLNEYPQVFQRQRERLMKYHSKQSQSRYRDVYATFEASAEVLERSQSEAATDALRLLELLSMLDSGFLPLQIFQDAWNGCKNVPEANVVRTTRIDDLSQSHVSSLPSFVVAEEAEWDSYRLVEATSLLASHSLVTRHDLDGLPGISMHPLTHAWAKDRQNAKQQGAAWITSGCVLGFSRSNNYLWQAQERRLLPHIQSYLNINVKKAFSFATEATILPITLKCGWALLQMRQDSLLGRLLQDVFSQLSLISDQLSEEFLPLYDLQSRSLSNLGKSKEAVAILEQVVEIRQATLAEDHPARLNSQHELAMAYRANGQIKEAVALLEQVAEIRETMQAEDHPDRLASQHALAIAYETNGQVAEAVALLEQVVKIRETMQAKDHPDRLTSQHALAIAYETNGQVAEAVALLEQVVEIRETTQAEDHPDRLNSQLALAMVYRANGQIKEAVALLELVVQIRETTLAEDHPDRLNSQHALAMAYRVNGQIKEAVALLEQVVEISEATQAEDHLDRLASQHELAMAYWVNGQVAEAVALLEQVVEISEATFAEDHPNRLASLHTLAMVYWANGQIKEAVALLELVVKLKRLRFHQDHPSRVVSEEALIYFSQHA